MEKDYKRSIRVEGQVFGRAIALSPLYQRPFPGNPTAWLCLCGFLSQEIIGFMETSFRYARTTDGVSVAFWTLGNGQPLVYMAGAPWCHVELLQVPECARWYEQLAEDRMLVRHDVRGTGLSDREIADHSLQAQILDLEAVIEKIGLQKFAVFAAARAGPVAIA